MARLCIPPPSPGRTFSTKQTGHPHLTSGRAPTAGTSPHGRSRDPPNSAKHLGARRRGRAGTRKARPSSAVLTLRPRGGRAGEGHLTSRSARSPQTLLLPRRDNRQRAPRKYGGVRGRPWARARHLPAESARAPQPRQPSGHSCHGCSGAWAGLRAVGWGWGLTPGRGRDTIGLSGAGEGRGLNAIGWIGARGGAGARGGRAGTGPEGDRWRRGQGRGPRGGWGRE